MLAGCHAGSTHSVGLPTRHSIRADQLMVLSDFKLAQDHPRIRELIGLRKQISETLGLPLKTEPVVVYLFEDEMDYYQYLNTSHPGLPPRRAYFIGTPQELAVYTYWGDGNRIQEDLRHEYTHGLLHSALETVPLWLDEGLAEYFEVSGPKPGAVHPEYAERLATAIHNGWKPDMERLERLEKVEQMQRADYREAWAWVHFMLHSSPDTKQQLLAYLQDLRSAKPAETLSQRLNHEYPQLDARFLAYLGSLNAMRPTRTAMLESLETP